jgi:hypothetical protein
MNAWLRSVNIENTNIRFISFNFRIFDLWKNKITCKSRAFATDAKAPLLHSLLQFDGGLLRITYKGLLPNTETLQIFQVSANTIKSLLFLKAGA